MAHYDITLLAGQSNLDGRIPKAQAPVGVFTGSVLNNVQVWNNTSIVPYDISKYGLTGNGASWILVNSINQYSFGHLVLNKLSSNENVLVCQVSNGGSRIALTGANDVNGVWNSNYGGIATGITKLLQELENRWTALRNYLTGNSHTYTVRRIIWHQGEADDSNAINYYNDFSGVVTKIRTFTGVPNLPIYYGTIPRKGSQYNRYIENAQVQFSINDANAHCIRMGNGDLLDSAHFNSNSALLFAQQVYQKISGTIGIEGGVFATGITRYDVDGFKVDPVKKYFSTANITNNIQKIAVSELYNELNDAGLLSKIIALYPCLGSGSTQQTYNLLNPYNYQLGLSGGFTGSTTGLLLGGINSDINSGIKIQDYSDMLINNWGLDIYSRSNKILTEQVDASWTSNNGSTLFRFFTPNTSSQVRMDLTSASALVTSDSMIDTLGLFSCQVRSGKAEIFKNGVILNDAVFTATTFVNTKIHFGNDSQTTRWSNKEYGLLAIRKPFTLDEMNSYYNIVQKYQTTLNREVVTTLTAATYTDVINRAVALGYTLPNSTAQTALETFMNNTSSLLKKLNAFYIFANRGGAENFAKLNLVDPLKYEITTTGITYVSGGFKGNSTSQYLLVPFNISTNGSGRYIRNNATRIMKVSGTSSNQYLDSSVTTNRDALRVANSNIHKINQGSSTLNNVADMTGDGFKAISRKNNIDVELYNNAVKLNRTASSGAIQNSQMYLLRQGTSFAGHCVHYYGIGGYLTEDEIRTIEINMESYLNTIF